MGRVIIGIHGLGNKPIKETLTNWWKQAIYEGLSGIGKNAHLPEFEMVYWADLLHDKPLNENSKDRNDLYYLNEKYTKAPEKFQQEDHSIRLKVIEYIGKKLNGILLNKDFSLKYSFLSDAIMKRYFKDLQSYYSVNQIDEHKFNFNVKNLIRERLVKIIEKYRNEQIFLIGHSMGSIIAFDVLTFMLPEIKINTFVTLGSPLGFPVVISKIAEEQRKRINGTNIMRTPPGIENYWYNFSDILDNIALNYKLSDDFSENDMGIKPVDFVVTNNYMVNGTKNPHKSFGYLRTPEFANVLCNFIGCDKMKLGQRIGKTIHTFIDKIKDKT